MKLKITLLIAFSFFIIACPQKKEDIYINIDKLDIEASCLSENGLEDTIICENNFQIYLNFKSSPLTTTHFFTKNTGNAYAGVAYAAYEPRTLVENKVEKCIILNTKKLDDHESYSEITNYFELFLDDSKWINDLSMLEGINEIVSLQYNEIIKPYFKLNNQSKFNYSGKFIVQMQLTNGSLLSDTTNYVNIGLKNN